VWVDGYPSPGGGATASLDPAPKVRPTRGEAAWPSYEPGALYENQSIGHKWIVQVAPIEAAALQLQVTASVGVSVLKELAAYGAGAIE